MSLIDIITYTFNFIHRHNRTAMLIQKAISEIIERKGYVEKVPTREYYIVHLLKKTPRASGEDVEADLLNASRDRSYSRSFRFSSISVSTCTKHSSFADGFIDGESRSFQVSADAGIGGGQLTFGAALAAQWLFFRLILHGEACA